MEKTITLNEQELELIRTLIEETILDDDGFDMTTKAIAKGIITKLEA